MTELSNDQQPTNPSSSALPLAIVSLAVAIVAAAIIMRPSQPTTVTIQPGQSIPVKVRQAPSTKPVGPLAPILDEIYGK